MEPSATPTTRPRNRIAELRKLTGTKVVALAGLLDCDQSMLWRYETGRSAVPDKVKLSLAEFFDVDVPYLMGWEDEPEW